MRLKTVTEYLLRVGVAFPFLYAPAAALCAPEQWRSYFPSFLLAHIPDMPLIMSFVVFELLLALWLLVGKRVLLPSLLAAGTLALIIAFNIDAFRILFRNVSILCTALALALVSNNHSPAAAAHPSAFPQSQGRGAAVS
jgi:hypothetical protein